MQLLFTCVLLFVFRTGANRRHVLDAPVPFEHIKVRTDPLACSSSDPGYYENDDDQADIIDVSSARFDLDGSGIFPRSPSPPAHAPKMDDNLKHHVLEWAMQKEKQNQASAQNEVVALGQTVDSNYDKTWKETINMFAGPPDGKKQAQHIMKKARHTREQETTRMKIAQQKVNTYGKNLESVGMSNKNMRQRMLKTFTPLPNPNRPYPYSKVGIEARLTELATSQKVEETRQKKVAANVNNMGAHIKRVAGGVVRSADNFMKAEFGSKELVGGSQKAVGGLKRTGSTLLKNAASVLGGRRISRRENRGHGSGKAADGPSKSANL